MHYKHFKHKIGEICNEQWEKEFLRNMHGMYSLNMFKTFQAIREVENKSQKKIYELSDLQLASSLKNKTFDKDIMYDYILEGAMKNVTDLKYIIKFLNKMDFYVNV